MPFLKAANDAEDELSELQDKAAFFAQLSSGADPQDDEWDPREARDRERRRRFFRQREPQHKAPETMHEVIDDDLVIVSGPTPKRVHHHDVLKETPSAAARKDNPTVIEETPVNIAILRRRGRVSRLLHSDGADETIAPDSAKAVGKTLHRSHSTPLPKLKRIGSSNLKENSPLSNNPRNKRLKKSTAPGAPSQQVGGPLTLEGCLFFYIPDNDIAPIRKIRIAKAKEHGAERTRDIGKATHVIVDRSLDYNMVQSYLLKADQVKPPVVVNDEYPIECIQFGSLVDPCQTRYRLEGQPGEKKVENEPVEVASSFESVRSLQLKAGPKNPRRWDYVPPQGTPLRSEESAQSSLRKTTPIPIDLEEAADPVHQEPQHGEPTTLSEKDGDELTELISALYEVRDLPVEVEDDNGVEQSAEGEDAEDEAARSGDEETGRHAATSSKRKTLAYDERFACNQAGSREASNGNPNARTIEILQKMATYYDRINDNWRTTAYRKAISTLKRQTHKITTEKEAVRLPSVGPRLAKKIEEIVSTDRLQRLEHVEQEPIDASLQLFTGIYGVGTQQALRWVAQGLRTLDDVREKAKLSSNQRVGLAHHDDLNTRIPRGEMDELARTVKDAAKKIDASVEVIVGGSYRRGADSSGDIDFILTRSGTVTTAELAPFLRSLVGYLESTGFLCARLASSRSDDDGSKWHGCCVLPSDAESLQQAGQKTEPKWRRIDMLLVPETERGAAMIYFTGNDIFNRSMRLLASRKGMRLNQRGLFGGAMRGPGRQKISEGELIEGKDEKRIFEVLGVRWREPHERWC